MLGLHGVHPAEVDPAQSRACKFHEGNPHMLCIYVPFPPSEVRQVEPLLPCQPHAAVQTVFPTDIAVFGALLGEVLHPAGLEYPRFTDDGPSIFPGI